MSSLSWVSWHDESLTSKTINITIADKAPNPLKGNNISNISNKHY